MRRSIAVALVAWNSWLLPHVFAGQATSEQVAVEASFASVLEAAGISRVSMLSVPAEGTLDGPAEDVVRQVLYRLERLDPTTLSRYAGVSQAARLADPGAAHWADIVELQGRVRAIERLGSDSPAAEKATLWRCRLELDGHLGAAVIWTDHVPTAWTGHGRLIERASVRGVLAGVEEASEPSSGTETLVVVASRVAWHPDERGRVPVSEGRRLLGALDVDVGLFDEVRHDVPLVRADNPLFYGLLSAVYRSDRDDLVQRARSSLAAYAGPWRDVAPSGRDGQPSDQHGLMAQAVANAAAEGRFSVAPLFLDADHQTGQLVLLEGVARRAIRIAVPLAARAADAAERQGDLDHYFELEVFTPDSQNLPLVFCVPSLPPDFPLGDAIRERVRLTGFFLKKWRYDSRTPLDAGEGPLKFQLTSAPLIIAAEPEWPLASGDRAVDATGWMVGGAFLGAIAVVGLLLWLWYQGDRRFRRSAAGSRSRAGEIRPPANF